MQVIRDFSEWFRTGRMKLCDLDAGSLDFFFADCPRAGHIRRGDHSTLRMLLDYLREVGVTPSARAEIENSELCRVERAFVRHLEEERGLSQATLSNYLPVIHCFLTERFSSETSPRQIKHKAVFASRNLIDHLPGGSGGSSRTLATVARRHWPAGFP